MTKLVRPAFLALVLLTYGSPLTASPLGWTDTSDRYGGFNPNSPEGNRAFWDYIGRRGG